MSQPPPPYGPPPGGAPAGPPGGLPSYPPPSPRRPRPRAGWFLVGGALVVIGVAVGIGLFIWTLRGFLATDAEVPADGAPHPVRIADDAERMLWWPADRTADCQIEDTETGEPVELREPAATFDKSDGSGSWRAAGVFDPGSGALEVTCDPAGGPVQIGPSPQATGFIGGIAATILVPLVLGGAGVIILLVTTILYVTGAPRRPPG